ncbi:MAG TPA: hypothetical protein DCY74_06470 [Clostridiales bacterium]|nr:hypothetical protein [Clostridiales bacterium]
MKDIGDFLFESFGDSKLECFSGIGKLLLSSNSIVESATTIIQSIEKYQQINAARKFIEFIQLANTCSEENYKYFVEITDGREEDVAATIMRTIIHSETLSKAKLLGAVYKKCLVEKKTLHFMLRTFFLIDKSFTDDLFELYQLPDNDLPLISNNASRETLEILFSYGYLHNVGLDGGTFKGDDGGNLYTLNQFGCFVKECIKEVL